MAFSDPRGVLTTEQIQAIQVATQGKLLDPATEKSLRSVFVGNIPNDVTEDQLKEIFSQVGPVLSFRIVYDKVKPCSHYQPILKFFSGYGEPMNNYVFKIFRDSL